MTSSGVCSGAAMARVSWPPMTESASPVLVAGARTPIGRFRGGLADRTGVELGAAAVRAALDRTPGLEPDYVVLGNVLQAAGGQNPGRRAALAGGVAREVPGITVNDVCLASLSSVALAASMIREGEATCAVVGGFDSMTGAPHAVHVRGAAAMGDQPMIDVMVHDGLYCSIQDAGMIELSDAENARLDISRADQDAFAAQSHARAAAATEAGRHAEEIVAVDGLELDRDEGIRPTTTPEGLGALRPAAGPAARSPRATPRSSQTAAPPASSPRRAAPAPRGSSRWSRSSAGRSSPGRTRPCTCGPPRPRSACSPATA